MAKRWYVLNTYAGYEAQVKNEIEARIDNLGLSNKVFKVIIPTEQVTEIKEGGKRVEKEKKILPGYILVQMEMDNDVWAKVRNIPNVTSFVGSAGKPSPLTREEFDKIVHRKEKSGGVHKISTNFEVGQTVKVINGALADSDGVISEINAEAGKVIVLVSIFGRETPVECTFSQITNI